MPQLPVRPWSMVHGFSLSMVLTGTTRAAADLWPNLAVDGLDR